MYNANKDSLSENGLALHMSPMFLAILFSKYVMYSLHDKFSSLNETLRNKTPRNFILLTLLIS